MLATALLSECPTAHDFARATPKRLAKLRYDGRHPVGTERPKQLIGAAKRSIGQHHGPAYRLQARHICQDLDLWRRRLVDIERDIAAHPSAPGLPASIIYEEFVAREHVS